MTKKHYLLAFMLVIGVGLLESSDLFAIDPPAPPAHLPHTLHQPPPNITGNEPGAATTLGKDGSTTTTLTTQTETVAQGGDTTTTTTTQTVTLHEDGTQTASTTTTVKHEHAEETDQGGSMKYESTTTKTTTTRTTDADGNTTATTDVSGESTYGFAPEYPDAVDGYGDPLAYEETETTGWSSTTTSTDGTTITQGPGGITTTTDPATGTTTTTAKDATSGETLASTTTNANGATSTMQTNKDGSKTTTQTNHDNSTTTTTTHKDGRTDVTTTSEDGKTTEVVKYDQDGNPVIRIRTYPNGDKVETIFIDGKKWRSTVYDKNGKVIGVMFWPPYNKQTSRNMPEGTESFVETGDSTGIFSETGDSTGIFSQGANFGDGVGIASTAGVDATGITGFEDAQAESFENVHYQDQYYN